MTWLLVRGLAREQRHWHGFAERWRARAGGAAVELVDVAGVGTEHRRRPRASVEWMARDVARRVPGLGLPGEAAGRVDVTWSIVGLSLGGMIALELCRLYPERIARAVIVNASSRLSTPRARLRPAAALQLLRAALSPDAMSRERRVLAVTSALPAIEREPYVCVAAEFARDAPVSRASVLAQLVAAGRFWPPAPALLGARLRFVGARNDALVSARCTRELAAWYGADSVEHPWAGHDLPLDDPEWLCDRLEEFAAATELAPAP
jgi:pimeloyl-ACP methyl ester carboxylesterase